jgi:hypothetical protein
MPRWSASSGRSTRCCRISGYSPIPGKSTVHLAAAAPTRDGWLDAALVTTNQAGGYASDEYTLFHEPSLERDLWILNPFLFFKKAFGDARFPVPDVTTLMGRRMYFSHIDGDGWNNVSEIETYRDAQVYSADVIRREVIEPYPDLPVSVGVIAGDTIPALGGTLTGRAIARKIYALPQVEVASHTYSHPFNWSFFADYRRSAEEELIEKVALPRISVADRLRSILYKTAGKTMATDKSNKYIAGSDALPRTYLKEPFDLLKEVQGGLNVSESLAPAGKKAMLYLWSGDTRRSRPPLPPPDGWGAQHERRRQPRQEYPSVFYVPPISRPVGRSADLLGQQQRTPPPTTGWVPTSSSCSPDVANTERPRHQAVQSLLSHVLRRGLRIASVSTAAPAPRA